ncbi:MAG TPA: hypothetical protein VJ846_10850 [Sphingomicrobium sp.]|nr:hypothetical protein [Sphingomicrobium sp.]
MISSYTDLQTAIIEYAGRDTDSVFIARVPTYIQLFEAKCNRDLFTRQMEQRSTSTIDILQAEPEFLALPSDFQSMRRIRLSSVQGKPFLQFKSGSQMDEFRMQADDVAGQPLYFTIFGSEIELGPTPDQDYTVEMIYRQNLPALASNSTNWLLSLAPDAYLYGSLMEASAAIDNQSRLQVFALGLKTAMDDLNALGMVSAFNAGPMTVRPAGVNVW